MKKERIVYKVVDKLDTNTFESCYIGFKVKTAITYYRLNEITIRKKGFGGLACFEIYNQARQFIDYNNFGDTILKCKLVKKSPYKLFVPQKLYKKSLFSVREEFPSRYNIGVACILKGTVFCDKILPLEVVYSE